MEESIETRTRWANYYAAILRASNRTEAAAWLQATHGTTDITDKIEKNLDGIEIVTYPDFPHMD